MPEASRDLSRSNGAGDYLDVCPVAGKILPVEQKTAAAKT